MNHVPQTAQFTCPCCKGFIGEAAPIDFVKDAVIGGLQVKIMKELTDRVSRPVMMSHLIDKCFEDDPDGGPENAANSIHVAIHKLRKRLSAFGWCIEGSGRGSAGFYGSGTYRLIPAEVTP